jgi:hypothetical protein
MQPGRREGLGGGGKVVPELQRFAVHHLFQGADYGQVCPAASHTRRRIPGYTSVLVTVEIVQDHLLAWRVFFDWPSGAAGG